MEWVPAYFDSQHAREVASKYKGILNCLVPCQEFRFGLEVLHVQTSVFCEGVLICDFGQLSSSIVELATSGEVTPCCRAKDGQLQFDWEAPVSREKVKSAVRPTQSVMYVPLQVNRFHESILLIVQYKYSKSCSGDFDSQESDPSHKIMRYWFYYSIWLGFSFPPDHAGLVEMICTTVVPVSKGHVGEASP